jgi:hypothetical protein
LAAVLGTWIAGARAQKVDKTPPASLVLVNGRIWTAEPKKEWVSAVAIRDNRILAVGQEQDIAKYITPQTKKLDLGGRFAMPGFNDAHIHFGSGALRLSQLDLNEARSLAEIQSGLRKFAAENPNATWVLGFGWTYTSMPGGRLPTRQDIDAVVKDRPVFLTAYDGHTAWANSKALELAEVTAQTKLEGYGEIVRDAAGHPTGVLKESAQGLVRRKIPQPTREERLAALRRALKLAASLGITSIQNQGGDREDVEMYKELLDKGELTVRVSQAISVGPQVKRERIAEIAAMAQEFSGPMLRVAGIKIMMDGVIETHTALMLEPYADLTQSNGSSPWTQAQANNVVSQADRAELQVAIHAIGDGAVRMALNAFDYASRAVRASGDPRFRIEHIETVASEDIAQFKKLDVLASMQPIHADPGTADVWSKAVGPERLKRAFAWREFQKAGVRLVYSSDWPACISVNPWRGIHVAVNRQTPEGHPPGGWVPEQKVTLETALEAYTRAGAFASHEKNLKGSIAAGRLADIIVLERDPFKAPPTELHKMKAVMTMLDGRIIFNAK